MREVRDSKFRLEDLFGRPVEWFAYPYGQADRKVRAIVAEAGFKAAVTVEPGLNHWQDRLALRRIEINSKDTLVDLLAKLITGKDVRRGFKNRIRKRQAILSRFLRFS
jgi:peptidoglycan/xylan/chitin deacetylase (PgdA/CDA1 family)